MAPPTPLRGILHQNPGDGFYRLTPFHDYQRIAGVAVRQDDPDAPLAGTLHFPIGTYPEDMETVDLSLGMRWIGLPVPAPFLDLRISGVTAPREAFALVIALART